MNANGRRWQPTSRFSSQRGIACWPSTRLRINTTGACLAWPTRRFIAAPHHYWLRILRSFVLLFMDEWQVREENCPTQLLLAMAPGGDRQIPRAVLSRGQDG